MLKKFFYFIIFLPCMGEDWAFAQEKSSIHGTIRGAATALHDATVKLSPGSRTAQTDDAGHYEFRDLAPGEYELIAHQHSFAEQKQTVRVTEGQSAQLDFSLDFAPVRQEVTVTASGREESTLETFSSVTSLDGQQLSIRNTAPALGELLEHEPGIAKRSFGPGSSRPVVRGFDGDRVLVLQDGMRTGTLSSQSGDHGEPVDGSSLERVEIVRGPATLLYGSNSIGGVVNVITRHHELEQHAHEGVRGHLGALGGTANALGGGNGGFEIGKGNYLFWAGGGGQRTGDYKTPIGTIGNSATRMIQTSAGFGRYTDRTFLTLSYGVQDGLYGVPSAPEEEGHEDHEGEHDPGEEHDHGEEEGHAHENVKIDWQRHNARFTGGFRNLEGWLEGVRTGVNYSDWRHKELEAGVVGTKFTNRQWTWDGLFRQAKRGALSGSFGVWGLRRDFKAVGEEALAPPVAQNAFALYSVEEFKFERIRLQVGGRLENNRYNPQGLRDRSFTGFSGSAGIYVPAWRNGAVIFNYVSSYRAPALEELYNHGPHLGNLVFEIGDENLQRERGHGLELSVRHQGNRIRAEISGFYNLMNNFVYLAPTGEIEDGLIAARYAQANARYIGADARLDVALRQNLWLNLGFDAVDAQIRESKTPLPRIPPVRGRVGLDWRYGGLSVRPELVLANRQWQTFPTETPTAGYATGNLLATYTIATAHRSHLFGVNFFNMTDQLYRNHLSFIKSFAPEIGRGVRFSYTVNFF